MPQTFLYDDTRVIDSLSRLGWKTEAGYTECDEPLSGRYYNAGFHGAVTIRNIKDCQPNASITDAELSSLLSEYKDENIRQMLSAVLNRPTQVEKGLLFAKYARNQYRYVPNQGKFVGERIRVTPKDYALFINDVILYFDGAATFTLYLVNEYAGITNKWTVTTQANKQVIFPIGEVIRYSSDIAAGGDWFLAYDQTELGEVKAIDYNPVRNCFKTFSATAFEATRYSATTFDMQNYSTGQDCYGINLQVTAHKDYTDLIIQNAHVFDEVQGYMMAAKVIELITTTSRSNATERIAKEYGGSLFFDLNGRKIADTGQYIPGLLHKIKKQVEVVQKLLFPNKKVIISSYHG